MGIKAFFLQSFGYVSISLIAFGPAMLEAFRPSQRLVPDLSKRPKVARPAEGNKYLKTRAIPPINQTYQVTKTTDTGASGELRWAIQQSNGNPPPAGFINAITFKISGTGPFVIAPKSDLDTITQPVLIDGYSQPLTKQNSLPFDQGDNATLLIVLNGSNYTVGNGITTGNGLTFDSGSNNSIVRGLVINQWLDNGIFVYPTNPNPDGALNGISIVGNFFGTNADGTQEMANKTGIRLRGTTNTVFNTTIGTSDVADRNLIAGSFAFFAPRSCGGINSLGNVGTSVVNNYIGTDRTGTVALGNSNAGIIAALEIGSIIGGSDPSEANLISGQSLMGILLELTEVTVQGNYLGTDISGNRALANKNSGIYFIVGLPGVGSTIQKNLISGNGRGIRIGDFAAPGANFNIIENNIIGLNASGEMALPNERNGVEVGDSQNTIANNVIAGNGENGILIYSVLGTETTVIQNTIGTDSVGHAFPNGTNGIQIGLNGGFGGASSNTIGTN